MERPNLTSVEDTAQQHEGNASRVLHAVGHVVLEGVSAVFMPYSHAAEESVRNASPARRQGDKVNPYKVDLSGFVSTTHRT